jgi:WD repeat-containing protein 19
VLIARQEQEMGNYKIAHRQLFDAHRELTGEGRRPPTDLTQSLMLLHSYALVKLRVKRKDHTGAARLLRRVASGIDRFPAHVVPILTSTVIECQRAGLKRSALEFATQLMQPERRGQIAEAYKRKIETIVRKPDRTEADAASSPCPMCDVAGSEWDLACDGCSASIPYCIATGKRVRIGEWARCPECLFPCNAGDFVDVVAQEKACPMCAREVSLSAVKPLEDPLATMRAREVKAMVGDGVVGMNEE